MEEVYYTLQETGLVLLLYMGLRFSICVIAQVGFSLKKINKSLPYTWFTNAVLMIPTC